MGMGCVMEFKRLSFKLSGAVDDAGVFSGWANVFNEKDLGGDIVLPGAFKDSIAAWQASGNALPLLWNHAFDDVRGAWLELEEREKGLWAKGQLNLDTAAGRDARALLNQPAVDGLSIGYSLKKGGYRYDEVQQAWLLSKIDLNEISIVTFPMNQSSRVDRVKSMRRRGEAVTVREIERALRELGFSQGEAKRVAGAAGMAESDAIGRTGMVAPEDDGRSDGAALAAKFAVWQAASV